MTNAYFNYTRPVVPGTRVVSDKYNGDLNAIAAAFDKLPAPTDFLIGNGSYGTTTGVTPNVYNLDLGPSVSLLGYVEGMSVAFKAHMDSTGPAQININSLGNKAMIATYAVPLPAQAIKTGSIYTIRYDGSSFQIQNALYSLSSAAAASAAAASASASAAAASASASSASAAAASASAADAAVSVNILRTDLASPASGKGGSLVALSQGGDVQKAINYITLEMMSGADDDARFTAAVALQRSTGFPILLGWKAYTLNLPKVFTDLFDVTIIGMGKGRSVLNITHLDQGLRFGPELDSGSRAAITLKGFTVNRVNYSAYVGTIGPKNLYVSNRDDVVIEDVEVIGNIGYGIQTDYSENILINHCSIINAVGGYLAQRAGTDGIHLYRSKRGRVSNCYATNLGDDGFSCGSFNPSYPATDIIFENNTIFQCAGGFKSYSLVANVKYQKNTIDTTLQGAFYLTNDSNAIDGSYVKNLIISDNFIVNAQDVTTPTNIESGALRIRQWPDNGTPNASSQIDNVVFKDNIIETSGVLLSHVTTDVNKRVSNLYINDNIFRSPAQINNGYRPAIRLIQCDYGLEICGNNFSGLMLGAIAIDYTYGGFTSPGSASPRWKISDNIIRGYNIGQTALGITSAYRAIFVRETGYHINLDMTGNKISDGTVTDSVPPTQAVFTGIVSPLSFIEANTADGSMSISGGSGAYKGIIKYLVGAPSADTHYKNSHIQTQDPTTALLDDYICYKDGTYGSLSSVNATTSAGSRNIVVSSVSGIYIGAVISIAGVTGSFIIRTISGNSLGLSAACDASVSGAAVSYSAPTWRKLSWATTTPVSSSI